MEYRINSIGENAKFSRANRKQIELIASVEEYHDVGYVFPAAAKIAQTSNLQPRKEYTPGGIG